MPETNLTSKEMVEGEQRERIPPHFCSGPRSVGAQSKLAVFSPAAGGTPPGFCCSVLHLKGDLLAGDPPPPCEPQTLAAALFHRKIKLYIVHWLNSSIVLAVDHIKTGTGNVDQSQGQKLSHRTRTGPEQDCVTTLGREYEKLAMEEFCHQSISCIDQVVGPQSCRGQGLASVRVDSAWSCSHSPRLLLPGVHWVRKYPRDKVSLERKRRRFFSSF
eukprot:XP_016860936.1 uncharacterized protein LOC105373750 [Homo sapiens]